uniref:Uncharacterized protein n=1 Tax=Rhizophora mucronata TaxID=61149 RepID=A0A2P2N6K6_RHIMU
MVSTYIFVNLLAFGTIVDVLSSNCAQVFPESFPNSFITKIIKRFYWPANLKL